MTPELPADDGESGLQALWACAQAGDESAYREALTRIAARLRGFLRRRMQSRPEDLEDLVQETLLAIHLQRGTHDRQFPVTHWALAIARHKLMDLWRRQGRRDALHDPLDELAEPDQPAIWEDEFPVRRDLGTLLAALPTPQQQAIAMIKLEGLSVTEASERSGVSPSALKVQVHRGLKRLAELVRKTP